MRPLEVVVASFRYDGPDGPVTGERWDPPATPAPAVVVLHEYWGITDDLRRICGELAAEGFLVLALDAYHGESTSDPTRAGELAHALDTRVVMREVGRLVEGLQADPACAGKVGVMGFCLGGALSFACAQVPGVDAAVPFYGVPAPSRYSAERVVAPIQAHFAEIDAWASPEKARALQADLAALGKPMELHVYPGAGHAFMRASDPAAYHPASAAAAWARTTAFLRQRLG